MEDVFLPSELDAPPETHEEDLGTAALFNHPKPWVEKEKERLKLHKVPKPYADTAKDRPCVFACAAD